MSCVSRAARVPSLCLALTTALTGGLTLAASGPAAPAAGLPPPGLPVTQSAKVQMLPPIAQPGARTRSPAAARSVLAARFRPTIPGRKAVLEVRRGGDWHRVTARRLDQRGRVVFTPRTIVAGDPATYRVRALPHADLSAKTSAAVRTDAWSPPAFVDTFDGAALGPAWTHRIPFYNPWGGRSCSKGDPSAVSVGGGALRLSVLGDPALAGEQCQPSDPNGNPVMEGSYAWRLNGHVSTQHAFDFQYGVAAARMKFQRPRGQHASFWMQPRGLLDDQPTPWGAEIDVIEWYGSEGGRTRMSTSVHRRTDGGRQLTTYGGPIPNPDRYLRNRSDRWWNSYHVFSVEWTPTEYVFRIDGHETMRTTQGVSHHPEFLILSMLSSDYELPWSQSLPQHAYVDWVQVWPQPPPH